VQSPVRLLTQQEQLNFLLTNRIPRRLATRFMGWYSRIESPALTRLSIWLWRRFADDLNLQEAEQTRFRSLQACFTRELRPGARTIDPRPEIVASPCDAIVGACGRIEGTRVYQAKGYPYEIGELMPDPALQRKYRDGSYVTLRLKSSMYHRFHAPISGRLRRITYISGDTWNVNPIALARIERLYCRNERAVLELAGEDPGRDIALVAVAAILVASIRLHCLEQPLDMRYRGPDLIPCNRPVARGEELGYFQHGSTIILFAPGALALCPGIGTGTLVRMGQALLTPREDARETSLSSDPTGGNQP